MHEDLLALLCCPSCKASLRREGDELLRCGCGLVFPVVDGVPRIFIGGLRGAYAQDFPEVVKRYPELRVHGSGSDPDQRVKLRTRESFGYEWTVYDEMLPDWEQNARFYFEPVGLESLAGMTVLDAGCGKGRHAFYAARAGARVIALDFSRAIDVAQRNLARAGDVRFVQADLMAPPFREGAFDLVYSFGVLHHLPDPQAGFRGLLRLVRPGGQIAIYLYHLPPGNLQRAMLSVVSASRRVTTRLPHRILHGLTWTLGVGLYGGYILPSRWLRRIPSARQVLDRLPLQSYVSYSAQVIINDQFDRFSAPIENRYTEAEVRAWFEGLERVRLMGGGGWRSVGQRPL